jgi:transposase
MDAYSLDLRLSIVRACVQQPETREEVAELFGVSRSFVQKLLRRWYAGMEIAPKAHRGGAAPLLDESARDQLRQMLLAKPDAALAELCQGLQRGRVAVSPATVCRALQDLELPIKKSRSTPTSGTRRGCGRYAAGGGGGQRRPRWSTSSSSMKAGPIPR